MRRVARVSEAHPGFAFRLGEGCSPAPVAHSRAGPTKERWTIARSSRTNPGCGLRPYPGYMRRVARVSEAHPGFAFRLGEGCSPAPVAHSRAGPTKERWTIARSSRTNPGCGLRPYPGYVLLLRGGLAG